MRAMAVVLQLHGALNRQHDLGLIIIKGNLLDPADLNPGYFHKSAVFKPADCGKHG